jgi:formate dehydrogenase (coenzyme F420) beta subunit
MKQKIIDQVKKLLGEKKIDAFLGLREGNGHVAPHLFTNGDELQGLSLGDSEKPGGARYPLNMILIEIAKSYPEATFGVLVRGCDERGLIELFKWNQLKEEKTVPVGIACPGELAAACECAKPYPEALVAGEKAGGAPASGKVEAIDGMGIDERFRFWMDQFDKCVKCYGCRNVCPMCFCNECSLEEEDLVETGFLPAENPMFHLTRAVHMIGRCIDCGLCEEACPADIPLRSLYKKVADLVESGVGYRTGASRTEKCPFNVHGAT